MELILETDCRAMLEQLTTISPYVCEMRMHYKPQLNGERYLTGEEVCHALKITKRTL